MSDVPGRDQGRARPAASARADRQARAAGADKKIARRSAPRFGVRRNQSGHLPRLDLVGSVARARNDSLNNLDQTSFLRSVGIQLTVPLYSGGGVEASVQGGGARLVRVDAGKAEGVGASRPADVQIQTSTQAS